MTSDGVARRESRYARPASDSLADILERVLDRGVVIVGDIVVGLLDIELLTLKVRLLIASADTARQMGIDWWMNDPFLNSDAHRRELERQAAADSGDTGGTSRSGLDAGGRSGLEAGGQSGGGRSGGGRSGGGRSGDGRSGGDAQALRAENQRLRARLAELEGGQQQAQPAGRPGPEDQR